MRRSLPQVQQRRCGDEHVVASIHVAIPHRAATRADQTPVALIQHVEAALTMSDKHTWNILTGTLRVLRLAVAASLRRVGFIDEEHRDAGSAQVMKNARICSWAFSALLPRKRTCQRPITDDEDKIFRFSLTVRIAERLDPGGLGARRVGVAAHPVISEKRVHGVGHRQTVVDELRAEELQQRVRRGGAGREARECGLNLLHSHRGSMALIAETEKVEEASVGLRSE